MQCLRSLYLQFTYSTHWPFHALVLGKMYTKYNEETRFLSSRKHSINQCIYQSVCIVPFSVDFALQFSIKKLLAWYLQNQMSNFMHMLKIFPNSPPAYIKLDMSSIQNLRISWHPQNSTAVKTKKHRLCVLVQLGPTVAQRGINSELLGCEFDSKCK